MSRARLALTIALALVALGGCDDPVVNREIGARCDGSGECDQRCLRDTEGYPGGFCTLDCASDVDCTLSTACVAREGGVCLYTCEAIDCRFLGVGWTCVEVASVQNPDLLVPVCVGG